jgi:hypothetical protein
MIPKPKKATRISDFLLAMKEPSGLDMSERIEVKQVVMRIAVAGLRGPRVKRLIE